MKAVLISIRPKWCELIATGQKTVEVRKTRPKLETPFKCYIYKTGGTGETSTEKEGNGQAGARKTALRICPAEVGRDGAEGAAG